MGQNAQDAQTGHIRIVGAFAGLGSGMRLMPLDHSVLSTSSQTPGHI